MKKSLQLICIGIILFMISCKKDTGNEINPLAFLSLLGDSTLTVTATYNGTLKTGIDPADGTGKIFVYLYRNLGTSTRDPEPSYKGSTSSAVALNTPATITINNIISGSYYILVFYDYAGGGKHDDNYYDRYILYDGMGYTSGASKLIISGDTSLDVGTFNDEYSLGDGSIFETTTTYTVTVPVTYTGTISTDDSATKMLYVYLYSTLGTATRTPALPVKTGISSAVASSGIQQNIAVSNVAPGNYYVLAFYDASAGANPDSVTDPYVLFLNTQYTANAQKVVISGDTTLPAMDIVETNTLQSGGAYLTPTDSATLTVTSTYSGSIPPADANQGTMNMYVYLYSSLGAGTRDKYLPVYTGVSAAPVTTVGGTATINVSTIIPGSYYILVFYDYRSGSNPDNRYDRYVLSNGVTSAASANTVSITSGSNTIILNVDNTQLQSGSLYLP